MKRLFTISLFFVSIVAYSQEIKSIDTNNLKTKTSDSQTNNIEVTQPDCIPAFPGGEMKLFEFIVKNLDHPSKVRRDKVQGRVIIKFVVTETGKLDSIMILKGIRQDLDNAAIQLVEKMPDWTPGIQNGKPVRKWCSLPITSKYQ
jgi:TonB family protein